MRPDPGLVLLERVHRGLEPGARARIGQELRERGFLLVWDQVDRAGPMTAVEQGAFILERLYPEMPVEHRASILRQMEAAHDAGTWHGFARPVGQVGEGGDLA
jgi:hypothetical protein